VKKSPEPGKADVVLKIGEAALAAIPLVGGPLATLSELLQEPVSKRRQKWLEELAETVSELERIASRDTDRDTLLLRLTSDEAHRVGGCIASACAG
jgi:hypothetical protein